VSLSAESAQGQAIDTLFGSPAVRSQTETSLLDAAGRDRVATGIRSTAGDPAPMSSTRAQRPATSSQRRRAKAPTPLPRRHNEGAH
jgi:hypothetical protein